MRSANQSALRSLERGAIALAVWTGLVFLLIGSVWELRSGAAERSAPPVPAYEINDSHLHLPPDLSEKLRKGNYTRLFDEARQRVRAWEKVNVK